MCGPGYWDIWVNKALGAPHRVDGWCGGAGAGRHSFNRKVNLDSPTLVLSLEGE